MKGSLRRIHDHIKNRTNFNNWSDSKCDQIYKREPKCVSQSTDFLKVTPKVTSEPKDSVISPTSNEIEDIQRKVKAGHPLLSLNEVRQLRLQFHENLLLNLQDDGFTGTYQFIKEIIDLDDEWHRFTQKDFTVKKRPYLKSNKYALRLLSDGLISAERARNEENKANELCSLLDLAISFTKLDDGLWYWLSEELYEQCIHITDSVELPTEYDRELAAILKFLFAEFLLDILHEPERAKYLLEDSMKLSEGTFYNASVLTGEVKNLLYLDSCVLLHRILLAIADENRDFNVEKAIELYKHSLHWAKVAKNIETEITALLHLVEIYITAKRLDQIPGLLENYLKLCTEQKNILGICEGFILSAKYHDIKEEYDLEAADLQTLLKTAKENNLSEMVALAHHKLAIFNLLHSNKQEDAQHHAYEAYHCYVNLNKRPEIEDSRYLIGICQGQGMMTQYIHLITQSEKACSEHFNILMKWNTLRIPFFSNVKLLQTESDKYISLQKEMEELRNNELNDSGFQ